MDYQKSTNTIDIDFRKSSHEKVLSNLFPAPFQFFGKHVGSMEGLLQSLKTPNVDLQNQIRIKNGFDAKKYSQILNPKWDYKTLYLGHNTIDRFSTFYHDFLLEAHIEMFSQCVEKYNSLKATLDYKLIHSIGLKSPFHTILTENEFIWCLENTRAVLFNFKYKSLGENLDDTIL